MDSEQPLQPVAARCSAPRRDGRPCTSGIVLASGFCAMHDPARQAELAGIRKAGGRARSTAARSAKQLPPALADIHQKLLDLWPRVESGELAPRVGEVLCLIASKLLDYGRFALEVGEQRELLGRIEALEQQLASAPAQRRYR